MTSDVVPAFNLLDEPWISVRTHTGEVGEVSLMDALLKARDYAALAETSPPNLIALYRLLLATLHRALTTQHGKWVDSDRARWFRDGLPEAPIRAYLEQWRDRFWLFHPTHPFMQVAELGEAEETREKQKVWTQVVIGKPSPSEPAVFDHAVDTQPIPVPTARLFCDLLGYLQFVTGKLVQSIKVSDKAGALANTAAVMPTGNDLSETLLLGLHPFDARRDDDLPAWERGAPSIARLRAEPTLATGPNDRYTRQSRAVLLLPDEGLEQVRHIRFAAGLALNDDPNAPDPMASYRINKDGKSVRISFSEGRAVWRDLPSLVPDASKTQDIPAAILGWAADLYPALGRWDAHVQILTAGLASDQAKLLRWRVERIVLPQALLTSPDSAAELRAQIRFGEELFFRLRGLYADMIAQTMPDPKHKDTRVRAREILANGPAAAVFFSTAERALPKLMQQIAAGEIETADRDWKATLVEAAKQSWTAARRSLGDSPAVLRADARTYPKFSGLLKSLVPANTESTPKEATS